MCILRRIQNRYSNKYLCMYVHCRIIYGGHKVNILQAVLYLHTMEYYSGIEKNELLQATTLMNLENIK